MHFSRIAVILFSLFAIAMGQTKLDIVCYTPFRDGQTPDGPFPTSEQLRDDIRTLKQVTSTIKISALGTVGKEIVEICHQEGMNIHIGAWLGNVNDPVYAASNTAQINDLVDVANKRYAVVKSLIVGSECLLRNEMTPAQLISLINDVKNRTSRYYPVTTAEIYAKYTQYKGTSTDISAAVDYILYNGHPYWEQKDAAAAAATVIDRWKIMRATFPGKDLILGEEGWPTAGEIYGASYPSEYNQTVYLQNLLSQKAAYEATSGGVKFRHMTFEGFDQEWNRVEGRVGGHWGLFYADRTAKPATRQIFNLPLALDRAVSYGDQTVELQFSDPVVSGTGADGAENIANYSLDNDAVIHKATLKSDKRTVQLVTSTLLYATPYTVTVNNIRKASGGNAIAANTLRTFSIENPSESYSTSNMVLNPDFSQGLKFWVNGFYSGGTGVMEVEKGELVIDITNPGPAIWCVQPQQTNLTLVNGKTYRLAFDMRSDGTRTASVNCVQDASPYTFYSNNPAIEIGTDWKHYCFTFTMNQPTDTKTKIEFDLGNAGTGKVYIDNVVLENTTAACPAITQSACVTGLNMVRNPGFDVNLKNWVTGWYEGAGGEMTNVNGELMINIIEGGPNTWSVQPCQQNLHIENGKSYRVSFEARADWDRPIVVSIREDGGAYAAYSDDHEFTLSTTKKKYCFTFTMAYPTNGGSKLEFDLGAMGGGLVWIDNVVVEQVTDDCSYPAKSVVWAVNVAGPAYTAADGTRFVAEESISGGNASVQTDNVCGTADPVLYKSHRWAGWSVNRTMANGTYDVVLKFVEDYFKAPGKRVFSVFIEGKRVISDLDIYDRVGHDKAYDVFIPGVTITDGNLTITNTSSADFAILSGIVVYSTGTVETDLTDLVAGTISARGQNGTNEAASKAFDNSTATKWLDFSPTGSWIQYAFNDGKKYIINKYTITSANDAQARDPASWQLQGSNDNGATWVTIDTRSGQVFTARFQKKTYTMSNPAGFKAIRLKITAVYSPSTANSVQLSEIELFGTAAVADFDITNLGQGTITARGQNGTNEAAVKAFDNNTATKWLDFSPAGSWIRYTCNNGAKYVLSSYTITSANDAQARDPASWQLQGSNDNGATWVTIDTRSAQVFSARFQKKTFAVNTATAFNAFRLNITSVYSPATANSVQLAEIELIGY